MGIKRYYANADTTITNAFKADLSTRGTGANMGGADVLEIFSIYGEASGSVAGLSSELTRALIKFPISDIQTDRSSSVIPRSGSVSFYLRMFNAPHSQTLPREMYLMAHAITRSWGEGTGLDMEQYTDLTYGKQGATWEGGGLTGSWQNKGGDFVNAENSPNKVAKIYFPGGVEDLEKDITPIVEMWANDHGNVNGALTNYGLILKLTGTQEAYNENYATYAVPNVSGAVKSYYTKKFFARSSEFFFRRPIIEARWDSSKKDNRGNFAYSSSLAPGVDNLNTLFLYNYVRGQLKNIPEVGETGSVMVSLYSGSAIDTTPSGAALELSIGGGVTIAAETYATGGWYETGVYTCSVAITSAATPVSTLYDVWSTGSIIDGNHLKTRFHTGSIKPAILESSNINPATDYAVSVTNLKPIYTRKEKARFRLYVRKKDWNPTIYTKATTDIEGTIIESASYMVYRIADDLEVVPYGTGSNSHTQLSFDVSGSYFDLDMGMLDGDYAYGVKFAFYNGAIGTWVEQPDIFKFRVEEQQT
jgi:hypothetical protein